jgi:hypothetical protein
LSEDLYLGLQPIYTGYQRLQFSHVYPSRGFHSNDVQLNTVKNSVQSS